MCSPQGRWDSGLHTQLVGEERSPRKEKSMRKHTEGSKIQLPSESVGFTPGSGRAESKAGEATDREAQAQPVVHSNNAYFQQNHQKRKLLNKEKWKRNMWLASKHGLLALSVPQSAPFSHSATATCRMSGVAVLLSSQGFLSFLLKHNSDTVWTDRSFSLGPGLFPQLLSS